MLSSSHHRGPGNLAQRSRNIHTSQGLELKHTQFQSYLIDGSAKKVTFIAISSVYLNSGGQGADQLIDLVGGVVATPNEHDLVRLGERRRDLRRDGGQRLQHQRHHRGVSVLRHRGVMSAPGSCQQLLTCL